MKVGAAIISHNHLPFIQNRVRSISEQRFKGMEVYAYDDHSIDGSEEMMRLTTVKILDFGPKIGRPLLVWQRLLESLHYEFLWFAEGDDACDPRFLERCVHLLESDERIGMAYCQSSLISATGEILEETPHFLKALHPNRWDRGFVLGGEEAVRELFAVRNTVPNASACVFRRQALLDADLAGIPFQLCGDWLAYARLARNWKIAYIPEKLNYYRVHSGTMRAASEKNGVRLRETYQVQAEIAQMCSLDPEKRERAALVSFAEWRHSFRHADRVTRRYLDSEEFASIACSFDSRFRERKRNPSKFTSPCLKVCNGFFGLLQQGCRYHPLPWGLETTISFETQRRFVWWRLVAPQGSSLQIELRSRNSPNESVLVENSLSTRSFFGWRLLRVFKESEAIFRISAKLP
ncbi:glycosyltransferase family 2 protein [Nibricoccus sp. IMCC34717]|uniref:glycosyltransferase family 2 protein n=1 Tax=Nibricoccus sp. IMCC34717 TaxID=3034021 RepID=UPI00384B609E